MASGRLMSLWRRWSQLTAGFSTAARKRAMMNQATKVRTCQRRKSAPSTTTAVSKAMATVRTTCEVEATTHPASWLDMDESCPADTIGGFARDFACGSACEPLCVGFSSFISLAPTVLSRVRLFSCTGSVDNRSPHVPGFFHLNISLCLIYHFASFSPWSGQLADRSKAISRPLLLLGEGLAQLVLLLLGQVGRDDLEVIRLQFVDHLVYRSRPTGQRKQGGGALRYLLANLFDEVVVDAHVPHRPRHPADRRAKEGHEEDHPDQETPECAPARAPALQLASLGLSVALGPADYCGVLQGDQRPLLHALEGHHDPLCSVRIVELQYG